MFGVATFLGFLAPNIYILAALRFIATLGLGAELVTGFAMVAEFAPIRHRGRWAGAVSFIGNIGSPLGLLLCTLIIPSYGWRPLFFIVGAAALILWMVRRHNIPESPRWLISQGREEEAKEIIEKMEINGSYEPINHDHDHAKHTINISLKRGLIVGIIAAAATTLCQYTFTTWVPTILVKQGGDIFHSLMFSTVMTIGAPLGALAGSFLIDMFGRRKTITTGFYLDCHLRGGLRLPNEQHDGYDHWVPADDVHVRHERFNPVRLRTRIIPNPVPFPRKRLRCW